MSRARSRRGATAVAAAIAALGIATTAVVANAGPTNAYKQTNLVSDINGVARITDPNLVNPWGQAASPTSPLWVADNGTNVSTLYKGGIKGSIPTIVPLVVHIPFGAPTGIVFNPTKEFVVHTSKGSAPANFIFASESGWITAWSRAVSNDDAQSEFVGGDSVYKGLALGMVDGKPFLYATNFHENRIDVFDGSFKLVTMPGGFTDPGLPPKYAPFGIQLIDGKLYVTYAEQNADKHDDVAGPGHGFVDVYDTSGHLLKRLITRGVLNSPWGLALAPEKFGGFGGDLLVGDFGDGAIHAFDPNTGALKGQLINEDGNPILINGLWALRFGNGTFASDGTLVFTAGIGDEAHGLLGEINPAH